MLALNDLKPNLIIEFEDQIYQVLSREFIKNARGKPIMSTKLKNLMSGKVVNNTFQQSDNIKEAIIDKIKAQYLYNDENNLYFMDNSSFEQFSIPKSKIGTNEKFLKEDTAVLVEKYNNEYIGISLPIKMHFKVISAPPDTKGNSAQASDKEVEIETGYKVKAPLFIKEGDIIKINTEKEEYVERVSK